MDLEELKYDDEDADESTDEEEDLDELDPIAAERKRRLKAQDRLRRTAGEPLKPPVAEVFKLHESFLSMLRMVLAE
jgi:hypothetical protein